MLLGCSVLFLLAACEPTTSKTTSSKEQQLAPITELEQKLRTQQDVSLDTTTANALIKQSLNYIKTYPADSISGELLFKAADVSRGIGHYQDAVDLWDRFYREYPTHKKAPIALFLKAFTADKDLQDSGAASAYYENFLQKYPDHDQAKDARLLLDILRNDQSPEELIKQFQQNNQE
ncbi:MAG: hypothetical protein DHS20C18_21130 [Saprospiraceae bacterium]|nr:MAG: hypothetical protein DHS20C18_21130 [Saprospiraceae bacterium]